MSPSPSRVSYSFGPGPITPAIKAIILANVAVFVLNLFAPGLTRLLGLTPVEVVTAGRLWQLVTYLFVHSTGAWTHILFNMLTLWMVGVDLERRWGSAAFVRYYLITGVGAGACVVLASLLPLEQARAAWEIPTIGASGAIYGVLLAWAILFPHRQMLFMMIFPLPARTFVLIMGAIAFLSALGANTGVSNVAHLGGLLIGWLYLMGPRDLRLRLQYRLTKWRMARMRRRFNIHRGGRNDETLH